MPQKYFQIDGVATFVLHTGRTTLPETPPATGKGETIVCLHGSGGNAGQLRGLLDALSANHTALAFDQPGHGRSGGLDSLADVGRMADFTQAFLNKLGLGRVVLLGHDLGAAVALRTALEAPDSVRALVLCSAGARASLRDETIVHAQRVSEGKERRPFDPGAFSKQTPQEVVRAAFMEGLKTDPRATHGDLLAHRAWDDGERLGGVRVPALVIHGADEKPDVAREAKALADGLANASLEIVPAAGHALPFEAPAALADAVHAFLGRSLAGAR